MAGNGRRVSLRPGSRTRRARSMASGMPSFSTGFRPTRTTLMPCRKMCRISAMPDFRNGEISVRFEGLSGRIDQGAGILFNLKPNGDYLTIRANCLENNLVLWKVEKGKRSSVKWVRNTPTATRQWHELKVRINGSKVEGYLDGKLYLEDTLAQPVSGRIGLWSKADSRMYFSDYTVTAAD